MVPDTVTDLAHACQAMLQALGVAMSLTFGLCPPGSRQSYSENRHPAKSRPNQIKSQMWEPLWKRNIDGGGDEEEDLLS